MGPQDSERPPWQRSSPRSSGSRSASLQGRPLSTAGRWRRSSPISHHDRCSSLTRSTASAEPLKRCSIRRWKTAPSISSLETVDQRSRCASTLRHSLLLVPRRGLACSPRRSAIASVLCSASTFTTTLISLQSSAARPAFSGSRSPLMPLRSLRRAVAEHRALRTASCAACATRCR